MCTNKKRTILKNLRKLRSECIPPEEEELRNLLRNFAIVMMIFSLLIQILQLFLALTLLVFVHELGHFLAARAFGVHVEKFYLFFDTGGKALFRYRSKRTSTEFGIGWLPLGGYCKIKGMVDEEYLESGNRTEPALNEMRSKPAWQRLIIMIAGIVMNLLLAICIYTGISYHNGKYSLPSSAVSAGMSFSSVAREVGFEDNDVILTVDGEERDVLENGFIQDLIEADEVEVLRNGEKIRIPLPKNLMRRVIAAEEGFLGIQMPFVVDTVFADTPAAFAGLKRGDRLLAIDTVVIDDLTEAQRIFSHSPETLCKLSLLRGTDTVSVALTPDASGHIGVGLAGLQSVYPLEHTRFGFWQSIPEGMRYAKETLWGYADNMKYVFTPEGANSMGGFISMGKLFSGTFDWGIFWSTVALLSIIFAFMNFLPIPMLDGAEILFLLIEMVTRRKIDEKVILRTKMAGLVLLIFLFVWANLNDVIRLF